MIVEIRNQAGERLLFIDGDPEQIRLNVPAGGRFAEVAPWIMTRRDELRQQSEPESLP